MRIKRILDNDNLENQNLYKWGAFLGIVVSCIIYTLYRGETHFYYDSWWYSTVAEGVIDYSGVHLFNFPKTFRGCLLPIYLRFLDISPIGIVLGWSLTASLFVGILFAFFLPNILIENGICSLKTLLGSIVSSYIYLYIWGDFLVYPMSDLFACFFMFATVYVAKILLKEDKLSLFKISLFSCFLGVAFYISYNTRVVYLFGLILILVVVLLNILIRKRYRKFSIVVVFFIVGFGCMSIPQCIINKHYEGFFSPKVYTENCSIEGVSLQTIQLVMGIKYPRYETYVGLEEDYPDVRVMFVDDTGKMLIEKEQLDDNFTISKFIELVCEYPLDMLSIYTKHIINAMTPVWNHLYIQKIDIDKTAVILISIGIWITVFLDVFIIKIKQVNILNLLLIISAMIPSFLNILGAVEIRFFLPVYILAYSYFMLGIDYTEFYKIIKKKAVPIVMLVVIISFLWISIIDSTLSCNVERVFIIH